MGRYSRKDMIEFANFAKNYQSSRNVEEAYRAYLKGERLLSILYGKMMKANLVYIDGVLVKSRFKEVKCVLPQDFKTLRFVSWNAELKSLQLKTVKPKTKQLTRREVRPLTEGKTKSNIKDFPNGIPPKSGPPPSPRVIKKINKTI